MLVFFRVVKTKFDEVELDGEAVECGVLHGPLAFALSGFDDGINFVVGSGCIGTGKGERR